MTRRTSRRKRILLIAGAGVAASLAVGGAVVARRLQLDRRALDSRDAGRAALAAGDDAAALDGIGTYLRRFGERDATSQDFVQYAKAREAVEMPDAGHLAGAMAALKKALDLDPSSRTAQDELLRLYTRTGLLAEAMTLADRMLETSPGDLAVLRTKADVLEALRKFPEALAVARTISGRPKPERDDVLRTFRLMIRAETREADVDAWLGAVAAAQPDDPFVDLLRGVAHSVRSDPTRANELLDHVLATSASAQDPELQTFLLRVLDGAGRFADALAVIHRLKDAQDPALRREIARRLWFAGETNEAVAFSGSWIADPADADAEVLAIRALALRSLGRETDATPLVTALAARTDRVAKAWSCLLETSRPGGAIPGSESVAKLSEAVAAVPESALMLNALGGAHAALGETDSAIRAWSHATTLAPAWPLPFVRLARAYRSVRRPGSAMLAARAAITRAPNSLDAMAAWVDVSHDAAGGMDAAQRAGLLRELTAAQDAVPPLADVILPVRAALLARTDKAAAHALIQGALDLPAGVGEDALLRLAATAADSGIPLADRLLAHSEKLHGVTPRLALTTSVLGLRGNEAATRLATFDELRSRVGESGLGVAWSVARASLLDALGRSEACAAWAELADAFPSTVTAQLAALSSASMWSDRAAVERTIDRVKALTGESGVTWRVARARLALDAPDASDGDVSGAAELVSGVARDAPENVAAQLLLAKARRKLGDADGAEQHLLAASRLAPGDAWITLELARTAQARGQKDEARRTLDSLLASKDLAPRQSEGAAYLLAAQGDMDGCAELLERLIAESRADRRGTLLLSSIYAKMGRVEDAIRLAEGLLDRPTAPIVEHAAGLYAAAGRTADAEAALARLDAMQLPAGDSDLVRARHAAQWGPANEANARFRAAVDAAPGRSDVWTAFVRHAVRAGDAAAVAAIVEDPRAATIDAVRFLVSILDLGPVAVKDPGLRRLVMAALEDEPGRPAITQALRVVAQDWPDPSKRAQTARAVRQLAESNVKVLVLQVVAVDLCAQTSEARTAADLARRTAAAFPNSVHAARQWAELTAAQRAWSDALEAGREWRDRAEREDAAPDEFIARMQLRLGRASDAAATTDGRVAAAMQRPEQHEALLLTHAVALLRTGRAERAAGLLRTLAGNADRWRTLPASVGPEWFGSAAEAVAWLGIATELAPPGDVKARVRLAQAWGAAWQTFRTPGLLAGANGVLSALVASPDAPASAHYLAGTLAQFSGDLPAARARYEAAIAKDPAFAVARNNLAMVLADSGRWEEAVDHAQRVTSASPRSAQALDTLAYALRKGRQFDEARARLRAAIELEPQNPEWQVSLAETCVDAGDASGLTGVLAEIRRMEVAGVTIPPPLRARIDKVRSKRD